MRSDGTGQKGSSRDARRGEQPPDVAPPRIDALAPREREIAKLVAAGLRDKEVGIRLGISTQTVKNRLVTIRRKLCVASRRGLRELSELLG